MTFYKLLGSRTLTDREEKADYLKSDLQWIRDTSEGVFDLSLIDGMFDSTVRKIRNDEEFTKEESRVAGTVFVGDSEFLTMNREWFDRRWLRALLALGDASAHYKFRRIARECCDLQRISVPSYTVPEEYMVDGRPVTHYTDSFTQRAVLASAVTSIDWLEYVFDELTVEYRQRFLDRSRSQISSFIARESYELDGDVAEFQRNMFEASVRWTEDVEEKFNFRSYLADAVCGKYDEIREDRILDQL